MEDNSVEKLVREFAIDHYVFVKLCEMGYYDDNGNLKESLTSAAPIVSLLGEAEEELKTDGGKIFLSFLKKRLAHLLNKDQEVKVGDTTEDASSTAADNQRNRYSEEEIEKMANDYARSITICISHDFDVLQSAYADGFKAAINSTNK